ncbi:MAG: GntR family transcriptional regulator [Actinobacteria bacterium]|nr:GntR family transcriptional regulator [Actinomycetota bacterium]
MTPADREGRHRSKSELVASELRRAIVAGEFGPGQPLRQRHLAARFRVSPTPVREALRRLESEGLVQTSVHRGAFVVEVDRASLEENYRIRAALEGLAADLATQKLTEEDLAEVEAIHRRLRDCRPGDRRIAELNRRLHFRIYECARSSLLLALLRLLWQSLPGGPQVWRPHEESVGQHEALLAALRARDPEAAAARAREHILSAIPFLPRTLGMVPRT